MEATLIAVSFLTILAFYAWQCVKIYRQWLRCTWCGRYYNSLGEMQWEDPGNTLRYGMCPECQQARLLDERKLC